MRRNMAFIQMRDKIAPRAVEGVMALVDEHGNARAAGIVVLG